MIKYPEGVARGHLAKTSGFRNVYLAMLLLAFQGAVTLYVHSTYLGQFMGSSAISALFLIGSAVSIGAFLWSSDVLKTYGNLKLGLALIGADFLALLGMGLFENMYAAIGLFILHQAITPLLFFNLDVFLESLTGNDEAQTGGRRGIMLTIMSLATASAPLGAGFLMGNEDPRFRLVYVVSALLLLPLAFYIFRSFKTFKDPVYRDPQITKALTTFWNDLNLRYVFSAHFLLQLFFAWMVIYVPLYLATEIGFAWDTIGVILFVGLFAYVLLEYAVGYIADRYLGEVELMAIGFFILAISTAWISFVATAALVPWMVVMFMTRVGASLVEATTESYFFKHATGRDANIISFFRITRPLAIMVGALLGTISLLLLPFASIFLVLGALMLLGIACALLLVDTR